MDASSAIRSEASIGGAGTYRDACIEALGGRFLPPDPYKECPPLRLRPAPIPPGLRSCALMELLIGFYRSAALLKTGKEVHAYRAGPPKEDVVYKVLRAGEMLAERRIPPVAWAEASFDQLRSMTAGGAKIPRLAWVWSHDRIEDGSRSRLWYAENRAEYEFTRLVVPAELERLRRDWSGMWCSLRRAMPGSTEELDVIVSGVFPGRAYDLRLAQAKSACASAAREPGWIEAA